MLLAPNVPFSKSFPLGHTKAFARDTRGFVEACLQTGIPVNHAKIAFRDLYFVTDPEGIRHVLQKNHKNYVRSFVYDGMKIVLGNGLITADGPLWLQHRRIIQPAFHRQVLLNLADSMAEAVDAWLENLPPSGPSLIQQTMEIAREILVRSLFGSSISEVKEIQDLESLLLDLRLFANAHLKNPFMPPLWMPTSANRKFKATKIRLKRLVDILLERNDKFGNDGDLLSLMRGIPEGHSEPPLTAQELYDEILTLFTAGQETSAQSLLFTFNELAHHPDALAKLKAEVATLPPQFWRDPAFFRNPSWLLACIKESLRLFPPAWAVSRRALSDDEILGYHIPKDSVVFLSIFAMHRHPDHWDRPNEFLPERFMSDGFDPKCFLPFGQGPRQCIGDQFALMSTAIILAKFYQRFDIALDAPYPLPLITPIILCPAVSVPYRITGSGE